MDTDTIRAAYARRMNLVADALGIPQGHGRQSTFGKMFGVTPKGARKWLTGEAYPEIPKALEICQRAGVNLNWLLQGTPPMRGDRVDPHTVALADAIDALPQEPRDELLAFLRFQLTRHQGWFTNEQVAHYLVDLEAVKARGRAVAPGHPPAVPLAQPPAPAAQGPQAPAYGEPGKHRRAA